jgi:hypothetical protein
MSRISKQNLKLLNEHINVLSSVFADCVLRNNKIIIVPILIYDNKDVSHANVLIYRKKFNQIEHFEPHGNLYMGDKTRAKKIEKPVLKFITKLNSILKDKGMREIEYISTQKVCPTEEGLQALEGVSTLSTNNAESTGYCIPWSMFFTELCLNNPNIESSRIFDIITNYLKDKKNIENYLRKVIRGYTGFIDEKVNKYLSLILGETITTDKINELYDDYEVQYPEVEIIRKSLLELIKLETYMLTDKDFKLENELLIVKNELKKRGKKNDIELLLKKKVLENYENFNNYTPVSTKTTSETYKTIRDTFFEKVCPEGKTLNPKTKRCNKSNNKTKKNTI